mmetsp:Transcript_104922/g.295541  ORF Transcript_104922/g.295541 Transcript_104922/m.295541 type:complete len:631 (-) Transcript_104922:151-2043(-)
MDLTVVSTVPLLRRQAKREQSSVWLGALRRWRRVTLGGTYLSSTMSRRTAWTWMFPVAAFVMCLLFCVGRQIHVPCLDVFSLMSIVVALLVASRLPATTLWPDVLVSVGLATLLIDSCRRMPTSSFQGSSFGVRVTPYVVLVGGALGWHSSIVGAFGVALSLFVLASTRSAAENYAEIPCMILLSAALVALAELCVASLVTDLQDQLTTVERLLDGATDGFCTLDAATSTMTKASPHLEHALGCDSLVGARLIDFVHENDWRKLDFSLRSIDIQPVHVTCLRKLGARVSHVFDAQIAPYTVSDGHLGVYLKVLGEVRRFKAAGLNAAPASLSMDTPKSDVVDMSVPSRADAQDPYAVVDDCSVFDGDSDLGDVASEPGDAAVVRGPAQETETSAAVAARVGMEETLTPSEIQDATPRITRGKAGGTISVHVQTDPASVDVQRSACRRRSTQFDHVVSTVCQVATQTTISSGSSKLPPLRSGSSNSSVSDDDKPRRAATLSSSSSSSVSDDDSRRAARRRVKALKPTPLRSCSLTIARAMRRWYRPCTTGACCPWHTAVCDARRAVEFLEMRQGQRCDCTWAPLMHWQCHRCLTGNENFTHQCATCGTARRQIPGRRVVTVKANSPYRVSL